MSLRAIRSNILFTFLQDIENKAFVNKTDWGLEIRNPVTDVHAPRWGIVKVIGDDVTNVSVGDYVLVEKLQWTLKMEHEGDNFWGTDESKIIAVSKLMPAL